MRVIILCLPATEKEKKRLTLARKTVNNNYFDSFCLTVFENTAINCDVC